MGQTMAELFTTPARATDANGENLSGAKWFFYQTGTLTPQSVFTTAALSTAHLNPVVADAAGKFPAIFFDTTKQYRGILRTADEATVIYDLDPINTDAMSLLAAPTGSARIGFLQAGTGAVDTDLQEKNRRQVSAFDFLSEANKAAAIAGTITEAAGRAAVQAAINSLGALGGHVHIEDGVKFDLTQLTTHSSNRFTLSYRIDDDQSANLPTPNFASGERVFFNCTSSFPASGSGGAVNEWRYTAPFHPGFVTDVRKDLATMATPGLGPSQTLDNPVRNSWNIHDEQRDTFRVVYENYNSKSNFSGVYIQGWRRVSRLNGIGTAQWSTVPTAKTTITGTTSGAKGFVLSVAAGFTEVEWFSGAFQVGETISDNNETTTATITSVSNTVSPSAWIGFDIVTGAIVVGDLPVGAAVDQFTVGGNMRLAPSRGGSLPNVPAIVTNPALFLGNSIEAVTPHQIGIRYRQVGGVTTRRLDIVDTDKTTSLGVISAYQAMAYFGNSPVADTNWHNIASVTRASTGRYDIVYTTAIKRAYGIPSLCFIGTPAAGFTAVMEFPTTGGCSVFVYNASGTLADIPASSQVCFKLSAADLA